MKLFADVFFELVLWLFILRAVVDFFPSLATSQIAKFIVRLTEPILAPLRRIVRPVAVGEVAVDLSSVLVVLLVYYLAVLL